MMNIHEARTYALSLPDVTEEPHFHFSSFRIKGKILATIPPDEEYLHIFVQESERDLAVAMNPAAYQMLWWGKKVIGLRVSLAKAEAAFVEDLLCSAWKRKAPRKLVKSYESEI